MKTEEKTAETINVIYLDIETAPGQEPSLDQFEADKRLKDPEKISANLEEKKEKAWRAQLLDPYEGQVYCIGIAANDEKPWVIHQETEKETMQDFEDWLAGYKYYKFVGHNILDFDAWWLYTKGLKYKLPYVVTRFGRDGGTMIVDTIRLLDGTSWKTHVSLDKMSKILLGRSAKNEVDGSMVFDLIQAGQGEKVIKYCKEDVAVLRDCYKELVNLGIGM